MRVISVAIPNYNRVDLLWEAIKGIYDEERISEIVVSDDCSDADVYEKLEQLFETFPKIKMYRNEKNVDCYENKKKAVERCTNEWVILLDSDNVISKEYIDTIYGYDWNNDTIYTPSWAQPNFDFRKHEGKIIDKTNVSKHLNDIGFQTMLNAANYFVNRNGYLNAWDGSVDPVTSDSIYMCYRWLLNGGRIFVVPGLKYHHRVHNGSHYRNNVSRTPSGFHQSVLNNLKNMK